MSLPNLISVSVLDRKEKCNSKDYEVYYIKADDENSDSVEVYVPQSNPYTISGNNADGFIITVEK